MFIERSERKIRKVLYHYLTACIAILSLWVVNAPQSASALDLTSADCRSCHGSNVSSRHHLLVETIGKMCLDCHQLAWDPTLNCWNFVGTHECKTCHSVGLADRHHILVQHSDMECFTCHAVEFDAAIQSYYVNFNFATARDQVSHYFNHTMTPNDCSGCHLNNLVDEHKKNCYYCHTSSNPIVVTAVTVGYKNCTACHSTTFKHLTRCAICHSPLLPISGDLPSLHRRHMHRVNCGYCHMIKESYELNSAGNHCAVCHTIARPYSMNDVPVLHKTHVTGRGYFPYSCYMCHGKSTPQLHPSQCSVCHNDGRLYDPKQLQTIHRTHSNIFDCTNCHFNPMDFMLYSKYDSCLRCHEARPYSSVFSLHGLSHKDKPCWACHPADELLSKRTVYPTGCVGCHPTMPKYPNPQWVHYRHYNYQCWSCHGAVYPICPTMKQPLNSASGSVEGLVTSTSGAALKDVRLYTQGGDFLTLSRTSGAYALRYLPPGYYRIMVERAGYVTQNKQLKILNGQTTTMDVILAPVAANMASITGRITDGAQNAISGAMIKAAGGTYVASTAPDGVFTIASIPPGSYSISVSKIGFSDSSASVTTVAGQASTTNVALPNIPQNVLCNTCHAIEITSKMTCMSKKWKMHFKDGRITKASFDDAEVKTLGHTCSSTGYWMGAASVYEEPVPALETGNLAVCSSCHIDHSDKVICSNMMWRAHARKNYVDQATYDLSELTIIGGKCN